jgi:hypothetical protein
MTDARICTSLHQGAHERRPVRYSLAHLTYELQCRWLSGMAQETTISSVTTGADHGWSPDAMNETAATSIFTPPL